MLRGDTLTAAVRNTSICIERRSERHDGINVRALHHNCCCHTIVASQEEGVFASYLVYAELHYNILCRYIYFEVPGIMILSRTIDGGGNQSKKHQPLKHNLRCPNEYYSALSLLTALTQSNNKQVCGVGNM